jgi:colanic acid/amylovoran biosynthesis glycosyltransferase
MNIAFIINVFPTLSETFILNQITGLIDRGHEVDIYAHYPDNTTKIHPEVLKYRLLERTYYDVSVPHNLFKRLLKAIWLVIINFHKSPFVILRSLNVFKYGKQALSLRLLYTVFPYIGRKPYDIIHCHFGPNGLHGVRLRELGAIKGKIVATFHGYDVNILPRLHGNSYYEKLFQEVDLCTINSDFIGQRIKSLGADAEKLVKLPVGVNTRKLAFTKRQPESDGEIVILSVGRLVEVKGIEYSIRAIAQIVLKFPNIQYQIAGDGPLREQLRDLSEQLGISEHVKLLGARTTEQVANLYNNAHIFILSGIVGQDGAEEGQGLVLLEAQAAELPVIASRVGGIPESVVDGESGFLVPERDVEALAEKLIYLIEHPEIWPEMGRAGRAYVEANYDINKLNDRLVDIYQELSDGKISSSKQKVEIVSGQEQKTS